MRRESSEIATDQASVWGLREVDQALCLAMQCHDSALAHASARGLVTMLGESAALALAREHDVASLISHALGEDASDDWHEAHAAVSERMEGYLAELDRVASVLAAKGIPLVALKNAGIARALHPCAGCCPMGDLDVMVRRCDFREAHRYLLELGYQFEFRSPLEENDLAAAEQGGGTEYWLPWHNGEKLWLELQWRPVAGRWIQPDQEPDSRDLMERSIPIEGSAVRLLATEDNLLQVALHTAKHSYVRAPGLRLHTDVDRIVYHEARLGRAIDWDRLVSLASSLRLRTAVYFSLKMAKDMLQTPVPQHVVDELRPAAWKERRMTQWIREAGVMHPAQPKFTRSRYLAFNALLFDDLHGLRRAMFPSATWMRHQYQVDSFWGLAACYVRRMVDLVCRRVKT